MILLRAPTVLPGATQTAGTTLMARVCAARVAPAPSWFPAECERGDAPRCRARLRPRLAAGGPRNAAMGAATQRLPGRPATATAPGTMGTKPCGMWNVTELHRLQVGLIYGWGET